MNLLSLGYALTPERAASIRRLDPRPFPFFGVYAVEDGKVAGQVLVYRLEVMTSEGPEDVGGTCAVCTHPALSRGGITSRLMDEAHTRMRAAGLRFSTLGTSRHRAAYQLYLKQGYLDLFTPTETFSQLEGGPSPGGLFAERAGADRLHLADAFYQQKAAGWLGFSRRAENYIAMTAATGDLNLDWAWLLWAGEKLAGYALASIQDSVLIVHNLLLLEGIDAAEAVAALSQGQATAYVQVRIDHASVGFALLRAGYPAAQPGWSTFMVKPLSPGVTAGEARRLFGSDTERFLISFIDVT